MLLIPYRIPYNGDLRLDAFSYSSEEIEAVRITLKESQVEFEPVFDFFSQDDRKGHRFIVNYLSVKRLENFLNLRFIGFGRKTTTKIIESSNGRSYKCQRADSPPHDCETFYAESDHQALVKCALIANSNNWFGGIQRPGYCGD